MSKFHSIDSTSEAEAARMGALRMEALRLGREEELAEAARATKAKRQIRQEKRAATPGVKGRVWRGVGKIHRFFALAQWAVERKKNGFSAAVEKRAHENKRGQTIVFRWAEKADREVARQGRAALRFVAGRGLRAALWRFVGICALFAFCQWPPSIASAFMPAPRVITGLIWAQKNEAGAWSLRKEPDGQNGAIAEERTRCLAAGRCVALDPSWVESLAWLAGHAPKIAAPAGSRLSESDFLALGRLRMGLPALWRESPVDEMERVAFLLTVGGWIPGLIGVLGLMFVRGQVEEGDPIERWAKRRDWRIWGGVWACGAGIALLTLLGVYGSESDWGLSKVWIYPASESTARALLDGKAPPQAIEWIFRTRDKSSLAASGLLASAGDWGADAPHVAFDVEPNGEISGGAVKASRAKKEIQSIQEREALWRRCAEAQWCAPLPMSRLSQTTLAITGFDNGDWVNEAWRGKTEEARAFGQRLFTQDAANTLCGVLAAMVFGAVMASIMVVMNHAGPEDSRKMAERWIEKGLTLAQARALRDEIERAIQGTRGAQSEKDKKSGQPEGMPAGARAPSEIAPRRKAHRL